jgi:hypothetical protein
VAVRAAQSRCSAHAAERPYARRPASQLLELPRDAAGAHAPLHRAAEAVVLAYDAAEVRSALARIARMAAHAL